MKAHQLIHQSKSNEWYTPEKYIEAVREVLSGIDLDPASCGYANRTVKATRYFTEVEDGLKQSWEGSIFLNPPYGKTKGRSNAAVWSQYLIEQYESGITNQAVLLVNACPGDKWFMPLFDYPICFTDHRIKFYNTEGKSNQPTKGNAFVYFGDMVFQFERVFREFGAIVHRMQEKPF